jgi:hypothetical protein
MAAGLAAVVIAAAGCHTMSTLTAEEVASLRPQRIYVTNADNGSVYVLSGPQVFNDTIVGYVNGAFTEVPATDVKKMAVRRTARGKTIALFAASAGVAGLIGVWISGIGDPSERDQVDCDYEPEDPRCQ